jgi:hypothetical protein
VSIGAPGNDDMTGAHDFGPQETGTARLPPELVATPPDASAPPALGERPLDSVPRLAFPGPTSICSGFTLALAR